MKNFSIKSFTILGLFGKSDISIPFNKDIKILIGENGLGKTQVLNIIYNTLTQNLDKLANYIFDSLIVEFDNQKIIIERSEIVEIEDDYKRLSPQGRLIHDIKEIIGYEGFRELRSDIFHGVSTHDIEFHPIFNKLESLAPIHVIIDVIRQSSQNDYPRRKNKKELGQIKKQIQNELKKTEILYFPTFRRVEEDLRNLGYDEERFRFSRDDNRLIHFGMDDVTKRFKEYTNKIDKLSKDGFSKISSEILSQLVKGLPTIDNNFLKKINQNDIEIILARVGNSISQEDKDRIKNIVSTREIQDKDHSLLYFLQKLIDIYEQQRDLDNAIKQFVTISNKYLVNKQVIYDESAVSIYIQDELSDKPLLLSKLSSGEKQIISIFSKIYLTTDDTKYIVIIDEPELSLSVIWQEMLLPDILKSNKCIFLLAATHSPFIYENELDKYAIGLHEYISKTKK